MVASTLPELLDDDAAARFATAGIPAISGLRSGLAAVNALGRPAGDPARMRAIAAAAGPEQPARPAAQGSNPRRLGNGDGWLSEHDTKELLRERGLPVVDGRLVADAEDAVAALAELGGHAAAKLAATSVQHKSDIGALALDIRDADAMREAHDRLMELAVPGAAVLVERMAEPGAELLVSARADGVVPSLVIAAGGLWTELLGDAVLIPLPASPDRAEQAIRELRTAPLFTGGRGRPALDVAAAARLAAATGDLLLDSRLALIELNPVFVHEHGVTVVDAAAAAAGPEQRSDWI
jgi:acyl-CoA synthetase (NDP forming)